MITALCPFERRGLKISDKQNCIPTEEPCAESARQALSELDAARSADRPYQMVLTDMHMPGMDGFGLVEEIRRRPEILPVTVVMLPSTGQSGDAEQCRRLGIHAYLNKPVRRQEAARGMQGGNLRSFGMMLDGRLPTTSIRRCGEDATLLIVLNAHDDNCPVHPRRRRAEGSGQGLGGGVGKGHARAGAERVGRENDRRSLRGSGDQRE